MIRLTIALLTLGVSVAIATTAIAQEQGECWWVGCNPEAPWCRLLCGSDPQQQYVRSQWQASYASMYPRQRSPHRRAKHHKQGDQSMTRHRLSQ